MKHHGQNIPKAKSRDRKEDTPNIQIAVVDAAEALESKGIGKRFDEVPKNQHQGIHEIAISAIPNAFLIPDNETIPIGEVIEAGVLVYDHDGEGYDENRREQRAEASDEPRLRLRHIKAPS